MKQYKVGHLAREMGVSADMLKLYEDYGMIAPQRDPESQYRYYDIYHGGKLVSCLTLRNMGFTVRQTAELLEHGDQRGIAEALSQRVEALKAQREQLDRLIPAVEEYAALCASFDSGRECMERQPRPGFYFLAQTSTEEFRQTERQKALARRLLEALPYSERLLVVDGESLHEGEAIRFQWGLGLREERAAGWPIEEMRYLPPVESLSCRQTNALGGVKADEFHQALEQAEDMGYTSRGDIVCQVPITAVCDGEKRGRRICWLPIEAIKSSGKP